MPPFVFLSVLIALLAGASTVLAQGATPDTPDRPTGTAVFIGGVDLEWNDVTGADSYDVQLYRNGQWIDLPGDGVEIAFYGAGAIVSGLDPGDTLWFQVRARNAHGPSDWSDYFQMASTSQYEQGRQPRPDNVPASGAPVISGEEEVGETLTADTGAIEDTNGLERVEFRFQWVSNNGGADTVIANATDSSYTLVAADEGNTIKVRVDFTDRGGYSESLTSAATGSVNPAGEGDGDGRSSRNSPATGAPTISGTALVGETLAADTSGIADSDGMTNVQFSYQWIRNDGSTDTEITGAAGSEYTLAAADKGNTIKVEVSFTDDAGNDETLTSAATAEVASKPAAPSRPTVESVAHNSVTIAWDDPGDTSITGYQVLRRNPAIHDSGVFDVIEDDTGSSDTAYTDATVAPETTYRYRVKARNAHGLSEWSEPAARFTTPADPTPPNTAPTGLPTIMGTAQVGETLSADTSGIVDGDGLTNVSYSYQWISNDGNSDSDIADATGSSYILVAADEGKTIKVKVSFTDDNGNSETLTSALTGTVATPTEPERTFVELSGGSFHMCGIATDGSLHCWGENHRGQIDPPEGEYKTLASGSVHTCAIATDGSIDCWGWDTFNQATPPTGTFKSIASHSRHSCAIATDHTIACWGYHSFAQNASPPGTYKSMAIGWEHTCTIMTDDTISCWGLNDHGEGNFPSGTYKAITAGFVHTCAIRSDDSVICRGMNNRGQTRAPAGSYVSISAGEYHTCAIATDDTITCWGDSRSGKTDAPGGTYQSILARRNHTCAIATDDSVSCWGENSSGQTDTPASAFKDVALSNEHTCGIATDGTVKCWGWNIDARADTPAGTYQSAAMGREHACAIATDNTISCWGSNEFGQADAPAGTYQHFATGYYHTCAIGTGDTIACWGYSGHGQTNAPSGTYQSIAAGFDHTCAIATDDTVSCWGLSANGRTIAPTGTYKALSAGSAHTCALATDDTITCWGDNREGQADAPTGTYQSISAGDDHSCAVATDSSVACWGSNASGKSRVPDGTYQSVSAGDYHTCAIATDDTIACWGYNKYGQVDGPAGTYLSVSIGEFHTCAVTTDNNVVCWGNERGGRCDAPTGTYQSIAVYSDHTVAIATDGTLVAWPGLPEGVTWGGGDQ
ncbi:MAG: fibronectin type III domain-containing protein [Chloroflexota bacterium]|nr:fibronectin type III domain-containing protein [Chloroflexota bacterium]MDE2885422.1 fibronectin type III domain-containing protein [Chloroflexota bacterium]